MSRFVCLVCSAWLLACVCIRPLHAEEVWTEIRTPHLRVVTNGSADQGTAVAKDFEEMRSILVWRLPGVRIDLDGPLTVYALRDFATTLRLHPKYQDPELPDFYGNWERNLAFVDLQNWSKSPQHKVFCGYAHEILRQNSFVLPVWLDRGWSQLLGSVQIQGPDLILGAPTERWANLKAQPLLTVQHILTDTPLLGYRNATQFERQQQVDDAWGLVHYLTFGPGMQSGGLLLNYYRRIQQEEPMAAFRAEFGDPAQMDAPFAAYIRAKTLGATVAPELPVASSTAFSTRILSAADAADEEGVIRIETHAYAEGRAMFERVLRTDASDALAHEELGILSFDEGHLDQARQHWQAAVAASPSRYVSRFALVMTGTPLRQQTADERSKTLLELQSIVKLNPRFSPAFVQIAVLQWWQGNLDAAVRACAEAERLDPARDDYHLLHGKLLLAHHEPKAAAAIARRVFDKEFAERQTGDIGLPYASVRLWNAVPAAERDNGSALQVSTPPGTQAVTGKVLNVQCARPGSSFRVTLQVGSPQSMEKLVLTGGNNLHVLWQDTVWIGGGHNPICFASREQAAFATYKPGSKGYGELEQFEVLSDVPDTP